MYNIRFLDLRKTYDINIKLKFLTILTDFFIFREFYYIQMEKYARQALAEGVKSADEIRVTTESELYRVLNLHYNRNNHIEVRFV